MEVKHVCRKCGYAEKYSRRAYAVKVGWYVVQAVLLTLGLFSIVYMLFIGGTAPLDEITESQKYYFARMYEDDMRAVTVKLAADCGTDSYCWTYAIYRNVSGIKYIPDSLSKHYYNPIEVYQNGGDCKGLSVMMSSMLGSVGMKSRVLCDDDHCILKVPKTLHGEPNYGYIIVDLTGPVIVEMFEFDDPWHYMSLCRSEKRHCETGIIK